MSDTGTIHAPSLGKNIGPLPAGVWVASIGGGLVIAFVIRRRRGAATPTAAALDSTNLPADNNSTAAGSGNLYQPPAAPTGGAGGGSASAGGADGSGGLGAPGAPDAPLDPFAGIDLGSPKTNDQWSQVAERRLLSLGFNPLLVDSALAQYLTGGQLSPSQQAVIGEALLSAGPPPVQPPPALPGAPRDPVHAPVIPVHAPLPTPRPPLATPGTYKPPAHKPAPLKPPKAAPGAHPATHAPAHSNRYTIRSGDTLSKIALAHHVAGGAAKLYSMNSAVLEAAAKRHGQKTSRNGSLVYPGTIIVL